MRPSNLVLEQSLDHLDLPRIDFLDARAWYDFLRLEYFRWKYTAPNRYATTNRSLAEQADARGGLELLHSIKSRLLKMVATTESRSRFSDGQPKSGRGVPVPLCIEKEPDRHRHDGARFVMSCAEHAALPLPSTSSEHETKETAHRTKPTAIVVCLATLGTTRLKTW